MPAPPPFPAFPSSPTASGDGRVYALACGVQLVAYFISDTSIPGSAAAGGVYLYAFVRGARVGFWSHTTDPSDILAALEAFAGARSGITLPPHLAHLARIDLPAPGAVPEHLPAAVHLDLAALVEGRAQPAPRPEVHLQREP